MENHVELKNNHLNVQRHLYNGRQISIMNKDTRKQEAITCGFLMSVSSVKMTSSMLHN